MVGRLDHVQIAIPAGTEDDIRQFFGALLGLTEIAKPKALAANGGCWFRLAEGDLHFGVDPEFRPARKAHIAIAVNGLDELRVRMRKAGCAIHPASDLGGRARFFTEDPVGNRVEFIEAPA